MKKIYLIICTFLFNNLYSSFTLKKDPSCCIPVCTNADDLLFRSVRMGKYDEARMWLNYGANPNARDKFGNTPLMQAAWEGNATIIRILLNYGADINATNNYNQTALMFAVLGVKRCAIKELLCAGANLDIQDCNGNTAIMCATFIPRAKPSRDVTCMIMQHFPNLKLKNECKDTLLTLAIKTGRYYLVCDIMHHLNNRLSFEERYKILNQRNVDKETAFMIATQQFDNRIACFLLNQGVDIEKTNRFGNSPLMVAVIQRNLRLMRMLLNCGVEINHQNNWGYTALMFSVVNDHQKMTRELLKCGADICITNYLGNNVIDIAAASRFKDSVNLLEKKLRKCKCNTN